MTVPQRVKSILTATKSTHQYNGVVILQFKHPERPQYGLQFVSLYHALIITINNNSWLMNQIHHSLNKFDGYYSSWNSWWSTMTFTKMHSRRNLYAFYHKNNLWLSMKLQELKFYVWFFCVFKILTEKFIARLCKFFSWFYFGVNLIKLWNFDNH